MNQLLIKKILYSIYAKFFYITIIVFLLMDIAFSNTIIKNIIKKDCIRYFKYTLSEINYYTYDLEKNCRAYETKKTVKTYNVFTDENGFRVSGEKKANKIKDNTIIFLGDSFTYGFGLNYEDSVVGIIDSKKTNYEIINLGVPGYSPIVSKYKLKKLLDSGIKPKKIFYLLDLTDVHDESNRWIKIDGVEYPVIQDKEIQKEIKKAFGYKSNFKMSRLLFYNLNIIFRNLRKEINQKKFEEEDKIIGKTLWGSFTHTSYEKLDKDFWSQNDFEVGINNITTNMKSISEMANLINSEFYIVVFPWPETLEYGEEYFSWQKFAAEVCQLSNCTKLINAFPEFIKIKNEFPYWKKEIYFLVDIHLNANGNRLLAKIIYRDTF